MVATDHERGQMYRMVRRTQKEYWDECRLFVLEMAIRPGGTCPSRTFASRLPRVSTQLERRMSRG